MSSRSPRDRRVPRLTPFVLSEPLAVGSTPTASDEPPDPDVRGLVTVSSAYAGQQALRTSTTPPAIVGVVVGLVVVLPLVDFEVVDVGGAVVDGVGVAEACGVLIAACTISRIFG